MEEWAVGGVGGEVEVEGAGELPETTAEGGVEEFTGMQCTE